ncbi:ExeM/NucH family extracellular endonuclease [Alteromonas sediminis]|uniref:ExeM/NucH family extracellular endonuclease n=1 Tax=Alteromonas sediminis TaxID=2259342 RepID=A0A3N5YF33_9ALTE|nr:ExeM/NucH family extracellular endonuclease [Alteromonas sediminis]RPJ68535.1 ExeM/NucH family extracellular endonuclease [Alteromonas sediminis]
MRHSITRKATLLATAISAVFGSAIAQASTPFINEIHYDNTGTDQGEFFEIAAPAGTDLSGVSVVLYNGSNGNVYNTINLSGVVTNQGNGFGTVSFSLPTNGLQNGSPDGLALVAADSSVIQFLSYEGVLTANNGPAQGMTSEDIGVSEQSSTPVGDSLQLEGTGSSYADFTWAGPLASTPDAINTNQEFEAPYSVADTFINEIHYDNTGTDQGEGFEIAGPAGVDLNGAKVVFYNGSNGTQYRTVDLTGILPDQEQGFGVLSFALPTNGMQNGAPDGLALVDADNNVIQFLSYEGTLTATNGVAAGLTSTDIGVSEASGTPVGHSLQLAGEGFAYSDFTWTAAQAATFGTLNTGQTIGESTGGGDGGGDGGNGGGGDGTAELGQCATPATLISAIQGSGDTSPVVGQTLVVEGVITNLLPDLGGFFMQEELADEDGDSNTSEGLFIELADSGLLTGLANEQVVRVRGRVSEQYGRTHMDAVELRNDCGSDSGIIAVEMQLPFASENAAEIFENMLVELPQTLTVSSNYDLTQYGQVLVSNGRLYKSTQLFTPGSAQERALEAANKLNQLIIDDNKDGSYSEEVVYPNLSLGGLSAQNTLRLGDTIQGLVGNLDYGFGDYRIRPLNEPDFTPSNPRLSTPDINRGNVVVASFNVLNYFTTLDSRGADNSEEFERQAAKIVTAIAEMNADVVGLMEIENNGFGPGSAIFDLVERLNQTMGEGTYAMVNNSGDTGTDQIKVGMIYKPDAVTPAEAPRTLDFGDNKNRNSLAQLFSVNENGETFVVNVNHLKSKGSGCGAGDDDTQTGQGNCNGTRTRAANDLASWLTQFGSTPALIVGDLNAYAKEDPITALATQGYTDLARYFDGELAYSYVFRGETGSLDYALANAAALAKVIDVTDWAINADEPRTLDYNLEKKTPLLQDQLYSPNAYRASDHDPVIVSLNFEAAVSTGDVNGDGVIDFSDYMMIAGALGATEGQDNYLAAADLDEDGTISFADLRLWYQIYIAQ